MLECQYDCFMGCDTPYPDARIVLWGAPFDSTTSNRPGARFGPKSIRQESFGLESYSPWLNRDLCDTAVLDAGDLELPFGDSVRTNQMIEEQTRLILADNKLPFLLGGEHSVSLGAVQAAYSQYPDLFLIHFDAHTDLRDDYLGVPYSHASVIRRCWDFMGDGCIAQFGIRSGEREEFQWAKQHTQLHPFSFNGLNELVQQLQKTNRPVYFTLDLDILDPSVFPGTGTPEAGGVSYQQLMNAIQLVCTTHVVGCDVVELAPMLDSSGISTATACKIVREMLLLFEKE